VPSAGRDSAMATEMPPRNPPDVTTSIAPLDSVFTRLRQLGPPLS
jgi:hypothetical protein